MRRAWQWIRDHRNQAAYLILTIGFAVSLTLSGLSDRRSASRARAQDRRDIARNCIGGQRSWDTLSAVIEEAYSSPAPSVDPKTLPPRTRALLADLQPLFKEQPGVTTTKERVLARLGARPVC